MNKTWKTHPSSGQAVPRLHQSHRIGWQAAKSFLLNIRNRKNRCNQDIPWKMPARSVKAVRKTWKNPRGFAQLCKCMRIYTQPIPRAPCARWGELKNWPVKMMQEATRDMIGSDKNTWIGNDGNGCVPLMRPQSLCVSSLPLSPLES